MTTIVVHTWTIEQLYTSTKMAHWALIALSRRPQCLLLGLT